jgi:iron complex outermembrane receptor protein
VTNPVYNTINGAKFLTGGQISGVQAFVNNNSTKRDDDTLALGWKNTLKLDKDWSGVADLSYSKAKRTETYTEIYTTAGAGTPNPMVTNGGGVWIVPTTLNLAGMGTAGGMSFTSDQNYNDPANLYLNGSVNGWSKQNTQTSDDQIKTIRLAAKRDLDFSVLSSIDVGANYTQRSKDVVFSNNDLKLATPIVVPASALLGSVDMRPTGFQGNIMAIDPNAVVGLYTPSGTPWNMANGSYTITEKVTTLYGKVGIDTALGSVPVRGNAGGQFISTKQTSAGYAWLNNVASPVEESKSYSNFLPSLNLAASLQPDLIARFGWGKSIMRPAMSDLRAGSDTPKIATAPTVPGGLEWQMNGGGNPALDPWKATGLDFSIEKYLDKRSYFAVAAFEKKLDSVIYTQSTVRDFSVYKSLFPAGTLFPLSNYNLVNLPANGKGGKISGTEVSVSLDGSLVSKSMEGLGVQLSSSSLNSELQGTDASGNPTNDPIDGLSGKLNTFAVYYERNGFSARVSQRSRAEYVEIQRSMIWGNQFLIHPKEDVVDLQVGYSFDEGTLKGLSLLMQVNNLTDEPSKTLKTTTINGVTTTMPELYRSYGKSFLFGATYKF